MIYYNDLEQTKIEHDKLDEQLFRICEIYDKIKYHTNKQYNGNMNCVIDDIIFLEKIHDEYQNILTIEDCSLIDELCGFPNNGSYWRSAYNWPKKGQHTKSKNGDIEIYVTNVGLFTCS